MLESYNYIVGILIGLLFSFNNDNDSIKIVIKNCLLTTLIYTISMSFVNQYFMISAILKLIYFIICFILVSRVNFMQSYYNSLIIVLLYLFGYVFVSFMVSSSNSIEIGYFIDKDCIALFISLVGYFYLNELGLLDNSIRFDIYDLILVVLITIILFMFIFILSYELFINYFNYYLGIIILAFIMLSIVIVVALNYCYILKRKENLNMMVYKAKQLDKVYYQSLELENDKLNKLKHDYKNHLFNLKQLIVYDNKEDTLSYLDQLINTNSTSNNKRYCGISYIDSYLNSVISLNDSIVFKVSTTDLSSISSIGFDILVILMNLIDNALENRSDDIIEIDIVYHHDLIIKVSNYTNNNPIKSHFKSLKGNNHGLGLKIIEDIINKYNGEIYDSYNDKKYSKYLVVKVNNDETSSI